MFQHTRTFYKWIKYRILKKALRKLSELQAHWLEIREFFQLIKNLVDEDLGKRYLAPLMFKFLTFVLATKVESYVDLLELGKKSASLRKEVYFKNKIYGYIQVG